MLKKINYFYLFSVLLILIIIVGRVNTCDYLLLITNLFLALSFFLLVETINHKPLGFFTKKNLSFIVFLYSLIGVAVINAVSYYYNDNFFAFSEVDALFYHREALKLKGFLFFNEGLSSFLKNEILEDFGAVFIVSTIYRIYDSNLLVNLFFIVLGVFTSISLFEIGRSFLTKKFAFLASLSFSVSSFTIWFSSSGLKEIVLIFIVVSIYKYYYRFIEKKRGMDLIWLSLFLISLTFFRPVIIFFCLGSFLISVLMSKKISFSSIIYISVILLTVFYFSSTIWQHANRFLVEGDTDRFLESKESTNMVKGGVGFTYFVNFVSSLLGPFPSFNPTDKLLLSFYSGGLLYRVLLSLSFIYGIYIVLKTKMLQAYPILLFVLFEMISLVLILEALELRKSLLHFPFIFILSFIMIEKYQLVNGINSSSRISSYYPKAMFLLLLIVIYWNFR